MLERRNEAKNSTTKEKIDNFLKRNTSCCLFCLEANVYLLNDWHEHSKISYRTKLGKSRCTEIVNIIKPPWVDRNQKIIFSNISLKEEVLAFNLCRYRRQN